MIVRYGFALHRPELLGVVNLPPLTWKVKLRRFIYQAKQFAIYTLVAGVQILNVCIFIHFY
jgi:hypothetical protein